MEFTLEDVSKRLSLNVIEKCFKVKTKSKDRVKSVVVTRAAPAGEGLISAVFRIHVKGSFHKISFVAKGLVSDFLLRRTLRCNRFFEREVLFFSEILPQYLELQRALGAKENIQENIPICYSYYVGDDEDYLLLEDLSESGCESVSKPTKRDRDLTLQVLAHLHAVSMAFRTQKPVLFSKLASKLSEVYYNADNRLWFAKYLQNAIEIDKAVLREYETESSIYYKKFLETVDSDPYGQLIDLVSYTGKHPTMNHGDAWLPNFMYSDQRVVAFDFQLLRCVSPVSDLTYYLTLCSNLCPTKEDFNEAINTYYSFLQYYLADMGLNVINIFPREDLVTELKKYGKFGLLAALTSIPLLASERCDVISSFWTKYDGLERIPLEELWKLNPLTDPEHKLNLVNAIRVAVDVGVI